MNLHTRIHETTQSDPTTGCSASTWLVVSRSSSGLSVHCDNLSPQILPTPLFFILSASLGRNKVTSIHHLLQSVWHPGNKEMWKYILITPCPLDFTAQLKVIQSQKVGLSDSGPAAFDCGVLSACSDCVCATSLRGLQPPPTAHKHVHETNLGQLVHF